MHPRQAEFRSSPSRSIFCLPSLSVSVLASFVTRTALLRPLGGPRLRLAHLITEEELLPLPQEGESLGNHIRLRSIYVLSSPPPPLLQDASSADTGSTTTTSTRGSLARLTAHQPFPSGVPSSSRMRCSTVVLLLFSLLLSTWGVPNLKRARSGDAEEAENWAVSHSRFVSMVPQDTFALPLERLPSAVSSDSEAFLSFNDVTQTVQLCRQPEIAPPTAPFDCESFRVVPWKRAPQGDGLASFQQAKRQQKRGGRRRLTKPANRRPPPRELDGSTRTDLGDETGDRIPNHLAEILCRGQNPPDPHCDPRSTYPAVDLQYRPKH